MMLSPAGTPPRGSDGLIVLDTCAALSYDAWPAAEQSVTLMSSTHSPAAGGRTAQLCVPGRPRPTTGSTEVPASLSLPWGHPGFDLEPLTLNCWAGDRRAIRAMSPAPPCPRGTDSAVV